MTFNSISALVWWLQNNGGGSVVIDVRSLIGDDSVLVHVTGPGDMSLRGKGRYLKTAVTGMKGA